MRLNVGIMRHQDTPQAALLPCVDSYNSSKVLVKKVRNKDMRQQKVGLWSIPQRLLYHLEAVQWGSYLNRSDCPHLRIEMKQGCDELWACLSGCLNYLVIKRYENG